MPRKHAITFTWFLLSKEPSGNLQSAFRELFLSFKYAGTVRDEGSLEAFFAAYEAKHGAPVEQDIQEGGKGYLRRFLGYRAKAMKSRAAEQHKPRSFYRLRNYRRSGHMGE